MKLIVFTLISFLLIPAFSFGQDTIVGWTFPGGQSLPLSNYGNENNIGVMYFEAANSYETSFGSISLLKPGFTTLSASVNGWDTAVLRRAWKFSVDATNYKLMKIYARISSDSTHPGPRDFKIQVMNGCCDPVWKDIPGIIVKAGKEWNSGYINAVQIPSTSDNMPGLKVRFLITSDTATDGTLLKHDGISLIDDIFITGEWFSGIENLQKAATAIYYKSSASAIFVSSQNRILDISIRELTGKLVYQQSQPASELNIPMNTFKKGLYLVSVRTNLSVTTRKINVF